MADNDTGGVPLPTRVVGDGSKHKFVEMMEKADGIEADPVSFGDLKKLAGEGASGMQFLDGERYQPVDPPEGMGGGGPTQEQPEAAEEVLLEPVDFVAISEVIKEQEPSKAITPQAALDKLLGAVQYKITLQSGFMSANIPVVELVYESPTVMLFSPIDHDVRLEPPHGEVVEIRVPSGFKTPLPPGESILFCTGIYVDVPKYKARCGVFLKK